MLKVSNLDHVCSIIKLKCRQLQRGKPLWPPRQWRKTPGLHWGPKPSYPLIARFVFQHSSWMAPSKVNSYIRHVLDSPSQLWNHGCGPIVLCFRLTYILKLQIFVPPTLWKVRGTCKKFVCSLRSKTLSPPLSNPWRRPWVSRPVLQMSRSL
jgi:hypothetical protein